MGTFRVEVEVGDAAGRWVGAYALEGLRLATDPVARRLVPVPGLLLLSLADAETVPSTETEDVAESAVAPPWMTILHNCDCHTFEQVVKQLQKAIGCSEAEGWEIAWQVHNTGKAVVKVGSEAECVRVGNILASIGLVVTVTQS